MAIKTIFLDRDGVINKDYKYLYKIKDFIFIEGVFEACSHFQNLGYEIIIVTNQSGIARGFYSEDDYLKITDYDHLDHCCCHTQNIRLTGYFPLRHEGHV